MRGTARSPRPLSLIEMSTTERPPQGTPPDRRSGAWSAGQKGQRKRGENRRVVRGSGLVRFLMHPVGKVLMGIVLVAMVTGAGVFVFYYHKYAKQIDETLSKGVDISTSRIYAAPEPVDVGDASSPADIATALRRAGFELP